MDANDNLMEYLARIVPDAVVECTGCGVVRDADRAVVRDGKFYCKTECADRANAVLRKRQPVGEKAGGYMDV